MREQDQGVLASKVGTPYNARARCPFRGMYDTCISGSDVNSLCCYGLVYRFDSWLCFEKPNRSSCTLAYLWGDWVHWWRLCG